MRPPICAICDKDFYDEGGMVQFALTEKDKENLKRFEEPGFVGHPPGLEWFCEEHIKEAKSLSHLTLPEAYKIMTQKKPE
ncbi:MAG: hypothetical protein JXL97_02635 [Bacteroidales bacterium]|nr:hypothetical protein [Bacteroidales bacterium]